MNKTIDELNEKYHLDNYYDTWKERENAIKTVIEVDNYDDFDNSMEKCLDLIMESNPNNSIICIRDHVYYNQIQLHIYSKEKLDMSKWNEYINEHIINDLDAFKKDVNKLLNIQNTDDNYISLIHIKYLINQINNQYEMNKSKYLNNFNRVIEENYCGEFCLGEINIDDSHNMNLVGSLKTGHTFFINLKDDEYGLYFNNATFDEYHFNPLSTNAKNELTKKMKFIVGLIGNDLTTFFKSGKLYSTLKFDIYEYKLHILNSKFKVKMDFHKAITLYTTLKDGSIHNIVTAHYDKNEEPFSYDTYYCAIINLLLNQEEFLFLHSLVNINDLPQWIQPELKELNKRIMHNQNISTKFKQKELKK